MTKQVDDLVTWLGQQLDEDEAVARGVYGQGEWREDSAWLVDMVHPLQSQLMQRPDWIPMITVGDIRHISRWDPARVLREVEAKRRIVKRLLDLQAECAHWLSVGDLDAMPAATAFAYEQVVRTLALPYSDRPGYRAEEWSQ